ncbi:MAG: hypothetical protein RLZZ621_1760 [Gemmatimonadota bacterium]
MMTRGSGFYLTRVSFFVPAAGSDWYRNVLHDQLVMQGESW